MNKGRIISNQIKTKMAKIQFVRIDNDESLGESEVVFDVTPEANNGANAKNRWFVRMAFSLLGDGYDGYIEDCKIPLNEVIETARKEVAMNLGIKE